MYNFSTTKSERQWSYYTSKPFILVVLSFIITNFIKVVNRKLLISFSLF